MTLSLAALNLLFSGALAIGLGLLSNQALDLVQVYVERHLVFRLRQDKKRLAATLAATAESTPLNEAALYGVAGVRWWYWSVMAAAAGTLLTWLIFPSGLLRLAGALAVVIPWWFKRYLVEQGRRRVQAQVRAFITDLRLTLATGGSLGQTLELMQEEGRGILHERLELYVRTCLTSGAGYEVLRLLARDMRSSELDDLIFRLQAAMRGAKSLNTALAEAAEHVSLEMYSRTLRNLKAAPVRLIIPTILTLFTPTLVLAMYPLVARVIEGLTNF